MVAAAAFGVAGEEVGDGDFEFGVADAAYEDGAVAFAVGDVGGDGVADDFESAVE